MEGHYLCCVIIIDALLQEKISKYFFGISGFLLYFLENVYFSLVSEEKGDFTSTKWAHSASKEYGLQSNMFKG